MITKETSIVEHVFKRITNPHDFKINNNGRIEIEVELKERMKNLSLRVPEDAIAIIDKTVIKTQFKTNERITRTGLIQSIVESLAEAFRLLNYEVDKIMITCKNENGEVAILIKLTRTGELQ